MTIENTLLTPQPSPWRRVGTHRGHALTGRALGIVLSAAGLLALGCAGSHSPPTQLMADVQSANRTANELGAQNSPQAKLHLKLAEDQLNQAKVALEDDDNERAEALLMRAKADAELAVALAREDVSNGDSAPPRTTQPGSATP